MERKMTKLIQNLRRDKPNKIYLSNFIAKEYDGVLVNQKLELGIRDLIKELVEFITGQECEVK